MSISKNKALIESFIEDVLNKHDLSAIEEYSNPIAAKGGGGSFKQFLTAFFTAFPDWHTNIEHIVAEDNLVAVFLNQTGTHKGEFQGKPPTNKPVSIRSADLYRIENEKIVQHWDVVDQLNLLQQTGITFAQATQE
ncbi:MAG TPA: ester cyclase [Nitrososphaeraceae archaeon]|nr:ester cyclase [Nitrososphaeraceae archaeon]